MRGQGGGWGLGVFGFKQGRGSLFIHFLLTGVAGQGGNRGDFCVKWGQLFDYVFKQFIMCFVQSGLAMAC